MRKIVFIIGQGGTGKTTLVQYFKNHPIKDWVFLDFDEGAITKPDTTDMDKLSIWVKEQREQWLKDV